MGEWRYSSTCS